MGSSSRNAWEMFHRGQTAAHTNGEDEISRRQKDLGAIGKEAGAWRRAVESFPAREIQVATYARNPSARDYSLSLDCA